MEAICSIGMKEDNLSLQELSSSEKRRTVKANKLKRQMQYRYEREQSEPAGTCEKQRYCSFSLSTAAGRS